MTTARRIHRPLLATLIVAALLPLLSATPAQAATTRLAVLYFDNNTADRQLDVLQKGLADMFITDLASAGLVVVERDKLQAILGELKLQRSRYINKRTAVKIGKGLGATHVVTGAFALQADKIRLDARLITVRGGRVVTGANVIGPKTDIFKLEQQLVEKFANNLRGGGGTAAPPPRRYRPQRRSRTQVPDVKTLVDYSRGLDLIDKGQFRAAQLRLAAVTMSAPTFGLAAQRERELKRRLKQAGQKRVVALDAQAKALRQKARQYVKTHQANSPKKDEAKLYLAYRGLLGHFELHALASHVASKSPNVVLHGHRKAVLAIIRRYVEGRIRLLKDLALYAKTHTQVFPNGMRHLDTFFSLPSEDDQAARQAGFATRPSASAALRTLSLARFLLLGYAPTGRRPLHLAPPPGMLDGRYEKMGYRLLKNLIAEMDKRAKVASRQAVMAQHNAIQARMVWGDALNLRGKRDAGIAKWQEVLDRYPTSRQYKNTERRIKEELGLKHSHTVRVLKRYQKGLTSCSKDMDLRVGLATVMYRRISLLGLRGIDVTIKEIEKACRTKGTRLRHFWKYLYQSAALRAGAAQDCKRFDRLMQRAMQEGLSPRDAGLYKKNYTSCP